MRSLLLALVILLTPMLPASSEFIEPSSKTGFADTLNVGEEKLTCTGAALRTKYGMSIYAAAHYGATAESKPGAADERLQFWIKSSAPKALVLKFLFSVPSYLMREAADEAFDAAGYKGENRKPFLDAFTRDYSDGTEVQITADAEGTLRVVIGGKEIGSWKDRELANALWGMWLGPKSVMNDRNAFVAVEKQSAKP